MHNLSKLCFISSSPLFILFPQYKAAKYEFNLIFFSFSILRSFICHAGRSPSISKKSSQDCLVWLSSSSHHCSFSILTIRTIPEYTDDRECSPNPRRILSTFGKRPRLSEGAYHSHPSPAMYSLLFSLLMLTHFL